MKKILPNVINVLELREILQNNSDDILVVDVRTNEEREECCISGTVHIPLDELAMRKHEIITKNPKAIYFQCRSGKRSMSACMLFLQSGFDNIFNVRGGMLAWQEAGF